MQTITFPSKDGLVITADLYLATQPKAMLVLCHRAHFSRGEYRQIAPLFVDLGYACLAIDQRAGNEAQGVNNQTYLQAKSHNLPTDHLDAKIDVEAAVEYAHGVKPTLPIVLLGSSYSASIALLLAAEHNSFINAVIACSPGEYLKGVSLAANVAAIHVPTLVLTSKAEIADTQQLLAAANTTLVMQYQSQSAGAHGASVLLRQTAGFRDYWAVVTDFLTKVT
jgi:alpha-beta hydrolase superfamily lysophospholipase